MRRADPILLFAVLLIAAVTLRPAPGGNQHEFRPFSDIGPAFSHPVGQWALLAAVVGNVVLFVPLGVALARRGGRLLGIAATAAAVSVAIELAQLLIPGRTTSFDDALTNTLGAALGAVLYARRL